MPHAFGDGGWGEIFVDVAIRPRLESPDAATHHTERTKLAMNLECQRWAELADLEALGEPLPGDGRAFQLAHQSSCADCAREAALWRGLRQSETETAPSETEVQAILSRAVAQRARRRAGVVIAIGGVAACAASLLLWFSGRPQSHSTAADPQARLVAPKAPASPSASVAPRLEQASAAAGTPAGEASCSEVVPGAVVCAARGSVLGRRSLSGPAREVEVVLGRAVVSLAPQPPGTSFSLTTGAGKVTAVGTIFAVDVSADGTAVARVVEGKVLARFGLDGAAHPIEAGQMLRLGDEQPRTLSDQERASDLALLALSSVQPHVATSAASTPPPAGSADRAAPRDMLAYARSLRANGDFAQAADVYRKIHAQNPQSASGRAALVSLGDLLLTLHDPQGALHAFDAYLTGGGALAQEAAFGRVRALRGLNRAGDEQRAIEHFLATYPDAPQSRVLRARLAAIQK